MAIQTKNSTETTRNSRKQQYCVGMKERQNHNLKGSRRKFGKKEIIYIKEKLKVWDNKIKLIVQQKNLTYKKCLQTKTIDNRLNISTEEPLPKEKSERDTAHL